MPNSLGNALKYTRRNTHVYRADWRVLVVSKTLAMQKCAADEILRIIEASSLKVESINRAEGWVQLEKGAIIRFKIVSDMESAKKLAGNQYCHIMWMYSPDDYKIRQFVHTLLRSAFVPEDALMDQEIDW